MCCARLAKGLCRRNFVRAAAGASLFALDVREVDYVVSAESVTLKELGAAKTIEFGGKIPGFALSKDVESSLAKEFNGCLMDGELHMNSLSWLSGDPDSYDWSAADTVLNFAKTNKMQVEAHHLVNGYQGTDNKRVPRWVENTIAADGGDPVPVLTAHINNVISHLLDTAPNVVSRISVVNEPLNFAGDFGNYSQGNGVTWNDVFNNASIDFYGDARAHMVEAFRTARKTIKEHVDQHKHIDLMVNEWGAEVPGTAKGDAFFELTTYLNSLLEPEDTRIRAGFQMHLWPFGLDYNGTQLRDDQEIAYFSDQFQVQLERLTVKSNITEFTVDWQRWMDIGGYSIDEARRLVGVTVSSIIAAYAAANRTKKSRKSVMFYDNSIVEGNDVGAEVIDKVTAVLADYSSI